MLLIILVLLHAMLGILAMMALISVSHVKADVLLASIILIIAFHVPRIMGMIILKLSIKINVLSCVLMAHMAILLPIPVFRVLISHIWVNVCSHVLTRPMLILLQIRPSARTALPLITLVIISMSFLSKLLFQMMDRV